MKRRVDDQTQTRCITLKAEAQLLEAWLERRRVLAQQRRQGPVAALLHRVTLLEREVPRLSVEVEALTATTARHSPKAEHQRAVLTRTLRGAALLLGLGAWVAGTASLAATDHVDHPLRLASMCALLAAWAFARH